MNLIDIVETSLAKADKHESKLDNELKKIHGMTGLKTRHFYNNLGSYEGVRYLEIGTWSGSSLCSFMCGNSSTCLGIDNWSEFGGPKHAFYHNFSVYRGNNNAKFIETNCWDLNPNTMGKFNMYMYDGAHDDTSHYLALAHFLPCLDDEFIYIVDDWNHPPVREGTEKAIIDTKLETVYKKEIFTNSNPGIQGGDELNDWHNGIVIYILRKQS